MAIASMGINPDQDLEGKSFEEWLNDQPNKDPYSEQKKARKEKWFPTNPVSERGIWINCG